MIDRQKIKIIFSVVIGISILVILLYFSDTKEIISILGKIHPIWIVVAILVYNVNWILRGYRWQLILDTMGHRIKLKDSISLTILGNFANLITPAKIGDAVRAFVLKKRDSVAFSKGLSSIIIDRMSDFFGVISLTYLTLITISMNISLPEWIKTLITIPTYILIGGFTVFVIVSKANMSENIFKSSNIMMKLYKNFIFPFIENIKMIYKIRVLTKLAVLSIILWILEVSTAFILLYSIGYLDNLPIIILAIMVGNLTKVLPLTPGGIGPYEGTVAAIFALGGLSYSLGLTIGILDHGIKNLYTLILGALSLSHNGIKIGAIDKLVQNERIDKLVQNERIDK